jgi:hypothetical protein
LRCRGGAQFGDLRPQALEFGPLVGVEWALFSVDWALFLVDWALRSGPRGVLRTGVFRTIGTRVRFGMPSGRLTHVVSPLCRCPRILAWRDRTRRSMLRPSHEMDTDHILRAG